jgi:UDP-N-acetylmuramate dehydrogenase
MNIECPIDVQNLQGRLYHNESLAKYTTWRVGGPAQWLYEPADLTDLIAFLPKVPDSLPLFWLGLGSNLLIRDGGIRGVVIATSGLLNEIKLLDNKMLRVEAGVSCAKVAKVTARENLGGAEFLAGIPGTMGGALAMNAGAWGGETWKLVQAVETLDKMGTLRQRSPQDYEIGYRSVKSQFNEWFVAAILQLIPNADASGQQRIKELLARRNATQPIGLPSCGSVFRNPPGDYAARLIEQDGWKGYRLGGACVSEKHANFIINENQATATEIEALIVKIQTSIAAHYGVQLVREVKIVGSHPLPLNNAVSLLKK